MDKTLCKVLAMLGGAEFGESGHSARVNGPILKSFMEATGLFEVTLTEDHEMFRPERIAPFDLVICYTTGGDLTVEQERGLADFVRSGKGFLGIHSAADSFKSSSAYMEMIGSRFRTHPRFMPHDFTLHDDTHPVTVRTQSFTMPEELYIIDLNVPASQLNILASATYQGVKYPVCYTKSYGKGRVVYISLGHQRNAFEHWTFQSWVRHGAEWATGRSDSWAGPIRCGLIGYGPAFGMGKVHGEMIQKTPGLKLVAACELDPRLLETAQADFPGIAVFQDYRKLAASGDVDLVVVITPHNTHRDIAVDCLDAGCHVIVEKPMAITSAECTDMIEAARKKARMVTVFHNRRLDSDFLTLLELVQSGAIGDIVHIEAAASGRHRPGTWWRSDKKVSGGIMHDWGAHFLDWMFQFVPKPILSVSGHMKKCIWPHVTIEDSADAIIRFEGGVTGRFYTSSIDPTPYPRWRIVGTDGAITADNDGYDLWTDVGRARGKFKEFWGEYNGKFFYWNIAGHLIASDPLMIKPEEARKIISVVEATETSSKAGGEVRPNYC